MGTKLRKMTVAVLLVGSAAVLMAPPAQANRGSGTTTTTTTQPDYVPPYGQNPHPELPDEPDPYGNPVVAPNEPDPYAEVAPTVVTVDLPAVTDPGAGLAGGGDRLGPAPSDGATVLDRSQTRPGPQPGNDGGFGGILSRTGAETLPLARAGLAALALGIGLIVLTRRRRSDIASA